VDFSNHPLKNNVNVRSKALNNVDVNVDIDKARAIATRIADKLDDAQSFKFFCKVAYNLPEHLIWDNLEVALTKNRPAAYFSRVCNIMIRDRER